ncbi:hypothetical protein EZV62_000757 [Acer yangbiense]|uniref:PGG domain-containing protein n=1 Tax=Acer yangbiense TaxID=1000413 RepID=A0A5C7ISS7_9ROSI|nr:hypothetical protein EZV62_000757 [Acer yangbiense]
MTRMLIVDGNTPLHLLATFRSHLLPKIKDMVGDIKLDLDVVNNQNMSVLGMMRKSGSDQLKQEILKLEESVGPYQYGVVRVNKEPKDNDDDRCRDHEQDEERQKEMEKTKESHLIVAALIVTVTFTAAFTLPGGVIQDGDKEGTAILSKKAAFQAFVITDAIAMVLSLSAIFAHFLMSFGTSTNESVFLVLYGAFSTMMAMGAMVIAFVTGTYAVLTTSLWLAILTTFIGFSFFIPLYFFFRTFEIQIRKQIKAPSFVLFLFYFYFLELLKGFILLNI